METCGNPSVWLVTHRDADENTAKCLRGLTRRRLCWTRQWSSSFLSHFRLRLQRQSWWHQDSVAHKKAVANSVFDESSADASHANTPLLLRLRHPPNLDPDSPSTSLHLLGALSWLGLQVQLSFSLLGESVPSNKTGKAGQSLSARQLINGWKSYKTSTSVRRQGVSIHYP